MCCDLWPFKKTSAPALVTGIAGILCYIELDYFLDYPGTSSKKFLTPAGNGHPDHLCSLPVVFQYWWRGFRVWIVSLDSLELNTAWCCALGLAHSGSPVHFHPVFSPCYVNSDQRTHRTCSLVLAEIYCSPPLRSKGMGFPRNGTGRIVLECL